MNRGRRKPAPPKGGAGCFGAMLKLVTGATLVGLFLFVLPWLPVAYLALIGTIGVFKAISSRER